MDRGRGIDQFMVISAHTNDGGKCLFEAACDGSVVSVGWPDGLEFIATAMGVGCSGRRAVTGEVQVGLVHQLEDGHLSWNGIGPLTMRQPLPYCLPGEAVRQPRRPQLYLAAIERAEAL